MQRVEKSILRLGVEFRSATVNFRSEGNFKCLLLNYFRDLPHARVPSKAHGGEIELVHSEFPTTTNPTKHHDLVILAPSSAEIFERDYGAPVGVWSKKMKFMCVLEVKFNNANPQYVSKIKEDIDKLSNALKNGTTRNSCFIIFIDMDVDWNGNPVYQNLLRQFKRATLKHSRLKVYCIPGKSGDVLCIEDGTAKVKQL